jgi:Protein-tyrosine phosphatase
VAKLFPDKNRSSDSIPYDHARVLLPTTTDDYINAAYVKVNLYFFDSKIRVRPPSPVFVLAIETIP